MSVPVSMRLVSPTWSPEGFRGCSQAPLWRVAPASRRLYDGHLARRFGAANMPARCRRYAINDLQYVGKTEFILGEEFEFTNQKVFSESSSMVTGPSFTSSTSIISWKWPVSQRTPDSRTRLTNVSYSVRAISGRAASSNDGLFPLRTSPYSVNCDTTKTAPPTSATDLFILPASSSKIRSPTILSAR